MRQYLVTLDDKTVWLVTAHTMAEVFTSHHRNEIVRISEIVSDVVYAN